MFNKYLLRFFLLIGLLLTVTVAPTVISQGGYPEGTEISLLQWSHFVPRYDEWFDGYAQEWGEANGVGVTVDHISFEQIPASITAEIDAGEGHTIIEWLFSPAAWIEGLHDLTDINLEAQERWGEQAPTCKASSYLPVLDQYYGFCHGYVPDPGDYVISMWSAVGYPDGPSTYDELLDGGKKVREEFGVPLGIGLSPELDSEMANRAVIWSFGGSIQDENENVVLNSPETIAAVEYMAELYRETMTEEVFGWNAASNNQGLIAGDLSYILNSISAYRSLQKIDEEAANDIGFTPALSGPGGQFASSHVWQIYLIPNHVEGDELAAAKQFILDHTENYNDAVYNSELYNFPAFAPTAPDLEGWLEEDPFGSVPADKLKVLATALDWGVHLGYPGASNPAIGQVFGERVIANMVARVALGEMTAEESVAQAAQRVEEIFEEWRAKGLVGGGD
jgi:multiple sugar transport system substrate-binding protein